MYVVLSQDVSQVGHKNAVVNVSQGYFMNYLQPRGLARRATTQLVDRYQREQSDKKISILQSTQQSLQDAQKLIGATITLAAKASDKGTLFRGITEKRVAKAVEEQFGISIDERHLEMEHFKTLGEHEAVLKIGSEKVVVKVVVEALK
ncbi:MAG: 50S ribosomal protein L9 [bacterium]|nr:50S ribosomal protein L9 [bacterium]